MRKPTFFSILFLALFSCKKSIDQSTIGTDCTNEIQNNLLAEKFSSPIKGFTPKLIEIKVNPQRDSLVELASGSSIKIPKNAFIHTSGEVVTDAVTLSFREFPNALATFSSGIPMDYGDHLFESAAMCEIKSLNPNIIINPAKHLEVSLHSKIADTENFRQYYFDENTQEWFLIGNDSIVANTNISENLTRKRKWVSTYKLKKVVIDKRYVEPFEPILLGKTDAYYSCRNVGFNRNLKYFRDYTSKFGKLSFQLVNSDFNIKRFNPRDVAVFVTGRAENGYQAQLTYRGQTRHETIAPIFPEKQYKRAMRHYKKQLDYYNKFKEAIEKGKDTVWRRVYTGGYYVFDDQEIATDAVEESVQNVNRFFRVNRFGIHNIDKIFNFDSESQELIVGTQLNNFISLHLIDPRRNRVVDVSNSLLNGSIRVFKKQSFHLVGNTIDGDIAYLKNATVNTDLNFSYLKGANANYENLKKSLN